MPSELNVNKISPASGTSVTLGDSGDTITIPSGVTLAGDGSGLTSLPAANLTGTIHADRYTDTVYTHPTTAGNKHIPTAGATDQVLTYSSSGTASWADPAGGGAILQCISKQYGGRASDSTVTYTGTSGYDWTALGLVITPAATSSHLWIHGSVNFCHHKDYCGMLWVTYNHSAISEQVIASDHATYPCTYRIENGYTSDLFTPIPISLYVHPNTTNAVTIKFRTAASSSTNSTMGLNQTTSGDSSGTDGMTPMSTVSVWEISGGISPSLTNTTINT
jgi:hypothetical protein